MDSLTNDFANSLSINVNDIGMDYLEIGIDCLFNDGILKEIPIVKSIVSVLKVGKNIYDRNLLQQTITFLKELNNGSISKEKLEKYKADLNKDPKKCEEELGRVLLYLNKFIDKEKSEMLSKLYKARINQIISWDEFCEYSEILDRIYMRDIKILKMIYNKEIIDDSGTDKFRIERLHNTGLIGLNPKAMFSFGKQEIKDNSVKINSLGAKFARIVFN